MIRLLRAELSRLMSRRFTIIALIGVLLALAAFQLVVNDEVTPPTGEELTQARSTYEANRQDWEQNHVRVEQECRAAGQPSEQCRWEEPKLADYTGTVPFAETVTISVQIAVYLAALVAFMIAGSYIGAEYSSGSIANWLTFIPRRGRVFASKLLTIAAFAAALSTLSSTLAIGAAVALARFHGTPVDSLPSLAAMGGRGVIAGVALTTVGFCVGLLARHTAAAIGVLLGYLFVWFVRSVLGGIGWVQRLVPWTPEGTLAAIVEKGHSYSVEIERQTPDGLAYDYVERHVSLAHGLVYWLVLLVVAVVGSWLVFRRRDVS